LRKYINFLEKENQQSNGEKEMLSKNKKIPLNQILYGPPGTGKTYSVIESAIEIIEGVMPSSREEAKEKFKKYQKEGQIEFVTFHQSYSYEEFVEGLKAKTDEEGNVYYEIDDGIFKELSNKAKENLYTYKNRKRKKSFEEVFKEKIIDKLETEEKIKIPLKRKNIYVYEVTDRSIKFEKENGDISHTLSIKTLKDIYNSEDVKCRIVGGLEPYYQGVLNYLKSDSKVDSDEVLKNYILIIDEINRGNISKIFGELITLIEEDKRLGNSEEMKVKLPYSKEPFGVPKNLYIIGTMNTADRSIALMDTALRRRFEFIEMMPEYDNLPEDIDGINVAEMLKAMNERIEYLYNRDHTIGHAYFINIETFEELKDVFKNKIIPLLAEYFYDEWEKIRLVLNDNGFIKEKEFKYIGNVETDEEKRVYEINDDAFNDKENYIKIYDVEA
jgi:5-methylcytosine-specific restriction protein B